jgi:hypothetical protein
MAEVVNSLFGITPESLQADRDAALQAQALQYAKLDPFQRATAAIYSGANRLGGAIGGMLGAQDPEMMRITQRRTLLQQAQPTNAQGWSDLGSKLMQSGDVQGAQEAYAKAQAFTKAAAEAAKTQSEIEKNKSEAAKNLRIPTPTDSRTPEEKNAAVYALTQGEPNTTAYKDAFADKFAELITKEGAKPTKVGITSDGSQRAVYSDGKTQFVFGNDAEGKLVKKPYVGGIDQTTAKTNVSVDAKGEAEFAKELGKFDAKKVSEAMSARDNAFATVRSLDQLSKLDDQGLISGSFASGRVGATNLLNTLGLASPADQKTLATSQNYQKVSGDVILGTLGGKLGAGFSNEDRKFIEGLVPQLETSPAARRQLITFMRNKNIAVAEEATRLETYARSNKGLSGFQPKIPLGQNAPASPYSGLSDAELEERIKRAKAAQQQQK